MSDQSAGIDLLLHTGPCFVINKPGGILTQAPPGIDSLEQRLKRYIQQVENKPGNVYVGVPHRLDRPVSGVMVFARHVRATRRLSAQFQNRTVSKKYWAVVEGTPSAAVGSWTDHMRKIPDEAKSEIVDARSPGAQVASLEYRILQSTGELSLLEIELGTGRTHQIRLQAAARGHSIAGDRLYGSKFDFGPQSFDQRKRWIALMARQLTFEHPMTSEVVDVTAPIHYHWLDLDGFEFDL